MIHYLQIWTEWQRMNWFYTFAWRRWRTWACMSWHHMDDAAYDTYDACGYCLDNEAAA